MIFWFKASETLLGIENSYIITSLHVLKINWFKASETLLGIENPLSFILTCTYEDSKPLKPF